jgi:hypothetical protein
MHAHDYIADLPRWKHPLDYGGFSPDGDILIYQQNRDSDALGRSNYRRIFADLKRHATTLPDPPKRDDIESGGLGWVYDFRARHWGVGWIEYILIRQDAPESLKELAAEIDCALSSYPVYDESDYSDLEWEEITAYWERCSVSERVELLQRCDMNIFAARRDKWPQDDSGALYDMLRD